MIRHHGLDLAKCAVLDHPPAGARAAARLARQADLGDRRRRGPDRRDRHPGPRGRTGRCARSPLTAPTARHWDEVVRVVESLEGVNLIEVTDRTFELHRGGKIYTGLKVPLKTRDDLSMAYTPGVARVCNEDRRRPRQGVPVHDQEEHGRRRLRRHSRARPRRHRARGGHARHGGQGDALQGVRRRGCVPDLPRLEGPGRDRRRRSSWIAPSFRRDEPGGHVVAALLEIEDRFVKELDVPSSATTRRHGDRRAGRALTRAGSSRRRLSDLSVVDGGHGRRGWRFRAC